MTTILFFISLALAVVISASLIIILIYNLRPQRKSEKLLSAFAGVAAEFNLSIARQNFLGNGVVGLDDVNKKVLFLKSNKNKQDGYLIDLEEIKSCKVKKTFVTRKMSGDADVKTIALQLNFKDSVKSILLPIYHNEIDPIFKVRESAEQALEWQTLLSSRLTKSSSSMENRTNSTRDTYIPMVEETAYS